MTGRATLPNDSAMQAELVLIPSQPASSTSSVLSAKAYNTMVKDVPFAPTVAIVPGGGAGRNLKITQTDANSSAAAAFLIEGTDQFGSSVSERFPSSGNIAAGATTQTGTKIFATVTQITPLSAAGAAADSCVIGHGEKVGIPRMFGEDLAEIKSARLVDAAGTTFTPITVNSTNLDSTYFAFKAPAFAASAVVAGDKPDLRFLSNCLSRDNRSLYPPK